LLKKLSYLIQYLLAKIIFSILSHLSFEKASFWGGKIFGSILSLIPKFKKRVASNLKLVFPKMTQKQIEKTSALIFNNIGRTIAEFPHINQMSEKEFYERLTIYGQNNLPENAIFFTAHLSNWEILRRFLTDRYKDTAIVYRHSNNPFFDKIINQMRAVGTKNNLYLVNKGKQGAKEIIKHLQAKHTLGMLVDQRLNEGIRIPFLGHDAMTPPAIASLALKYNVPLIGFRAKRINETDFEIVIHEPLDLKDKSVEEIMREVNNIMSEWIIESKEEWLWIHNRWRI